MKAPAKICDTCHKSAFSILLLRPSPVAKARELAPPDAATVTSDPALTANILPKYVPTESRYALRLLRAGYVHVFIPKPPVGMKHWLVYRVTDQADLVIEASSLFRQPEAGIACNRADHNAAGLKVLTLPQAHMISDIWIAFSANLWNEKTRRLNQAKPETMQHIVLGGKCTNTFKPTAENLKSKVLECAMKSLVTAKASDHDFAFNSIADQTEDLARQLTRMAACHPKTKGREIAVVLRDPVGIATELNELRIRRNELAKQEIAKPENAHPLNSSNALLGMKKSLLDSHLANNYIDVCPIRTRSKFDAETWPPGTTWKPLTSSDRSILVQSASSSVLMLPYKLMFERPDMGRVFYPDLDARAARWALQQTEETWSKIAPFYDEDARAKWIAMFEEKLQASHYDPLARYETDWRGVADDQQTLDYFKKHFDPDDANDPLNTHCPGLVYSRESQYIHAPAPFTSGSVLERYLDLLDKPITDDAAVVQRAVAGNQLSLIKLIHATLTGDAGKEPEDGGGVRDKTFDFTKELLKETGPGKALLHKYSWLGSGLALFSIGQLSALSGAALTVAAKSPAMTPRVHQALRTLQKLWGVQQALDLALLGALSKQAPKLPVLITMKVDVDEALAIVRARKGQGLGVSRSQIKRLKGSNPLAKISLSVLTDTDSLHAAQGELKGLLKDAGTGTVSMKGGAAAAEIAAAGSAAVLTEAQFLKLYQQQSELVGHGLSAIQRTMTEAGADIRAITTSLDGRLALGSIVVQGIGLINGLKALDSAKDEETVRFAWYGIYDSTAGTLGGLLSLWAVAVNTRTVAQAGTEAAEKSLGLGAMRFMANVAGAAGGAVNAAAAWANSDKAKKIGNIDARLYYQLSSVSFAGTVVTSSALAAGAISETLVARGVGGAVARSLAVRFGAEGTASLLGISLSGWGLLLLGAGVVAQVAAIEMTPTPVQQWVKQSFFGRGAKKFPIGDWKAEFEALRSTLDQALEGEKGRTSAQPEAAAAEAH